jgi:hypothetical protein
VDKVKAGARRARYLEIERLYRSGLTLGQIGAQLDPPATPQWVGQLLRQGAELGLYLMPEMHQDRLRRTEQRLTDLEVRAALMATRRKEQAAKMLGISKAALETRFGHVVTGVARERRRERTRTAIVDAYRALAARLGHDPNTSEIPRRLIGRIQHGFGTLRKFYAAVGAQPMDRRRRADRPDTLQDRSNPL